MAAFSTSFDQQNRVGSDRLSPQLSRILITNEIGDVVAVTSPPEFAAENAPIGSSFFDICGPYFSLKEPEADRLCAAVRSVLHEESTQQEGMLQTHSSGGEHLCYRIDPLAGAVGVALSWGFVAEEHSVQETPQSPDEPEETHFFDISADPMCVVDAGLVIRRINEAFERNFMRPREDVLGCPCCEVIHGAGCQKESCPVESILSGEPRVENELDVPLVEGRNCSCILTAVPLPGKENKPGGAVLHFKDISTHAEYERQLSLARDEARAAMETKTQFLATISHEIRTPITTIMGMVELLQETSSDPMQKRYLHLLNRSSRSLLNLCSDILDLSRLERGKFELQKENFDLRELVEEIMEFMSYRIQKKDVRLRHFFDGRVPQLVNGDVKRLSQVLCNLVGNAIKFTSTGEVEMKVLPGETPDMVCFEVRDTGIGIPEEMQPFVFESFTQADPSVAHFYGGSGLGLTVCKMLVENMDGRIWMQSQPGKGSTFTFKIPLIIS